MSLIAKVGRPLQKSAPVRVLGIDPGTLVTGYGIIEGDGNRLKHIASGVIRTKSNAPLSDRLKTIYSGLVEVIEAHSPGLGAIESIFHAQNVQSALKLGHARGVAMLAMVNSDLTVAEYLPMEVKKSVCSYGHADKEQVQKMVQVLLGFKTEEVFDATDALAVAICHFYTHRTNARSAPGVR